MPNNCLSVLYKRIIQVENKNVGLKVGGHKHTIAPPIKKVGGHMPTLSPPPPASYASVYIYIVEETRKLSFILQLKCLNLVNTPNLLSNRWS